MTGSRKKELVDQDHTYTVVAPGVLRHIPSGTVGAQGDVQAWQKVQEQVDRG